MNRYFIATMLCLITHLGVQAQHSAVMPTSSFAVGGLVQHQLSFSLAQLLEMPQDTVGDVIVTNKKGEWKETVRGVRGVKLKTILDSAGIELANHKDYGALVIVLKASDGYTNVYSWNELYNNKAGDKVYIVTAMNGTEGAAVKDHILVINTSDIISGRRHLKYLSTIEVRKLD
jgi:DMSO/TMAO reductase YedYZ molybdopterin-dependent catalytic subunit